LRSGGKAGPHRGDKGNANMEEKGHNLIKSGTSLLIGSPPQKKLGDLRTTVPGEKEKKKKTKKPTHAVKLAGVEEKKEVCLQEIGDFAPNSHQKKLKRKVQPDPKSTKKKRPETTHQAAKNLVHRKK